MRCTVAGGWAGGELAEKPLDSRFMFMFIELPSCLQVGRPEEPTCAHAGRKVGEMWSVGGGAVGCGCALSHHARLN